jgi:hypothetical protein
MTHDHSSAATDTPGAVLDVPGATIYYQVTGSVRGHEKVPECGHV